MILDLDTLCVQNGPNLNPTPCFLLLITIKYDRSLTMETKTLIDSITYACFIDMEVVQQHKMIIMKKNMQIVVEVINNQNLSSRPMKHETKALNIIIGTHTSKVAFNVISSPTNLIVIGLSWFILHNP